MTERATVGGLIEMFVLCTVTGFLATYTVAWFASMWHQRRLPRWRQPSTEWWTPTHRDPHSLRRFDTPTDGAVH